MKVALVWAHERLSGGALIHIEGMVRHLSSIDSIELHLIAFDSASQPFKQAVAHNHPIKRFPLPFPLILLQEAWLLRREVLKVNPDVILQIGNPYSITAVSLRDKFPILLELIGLTPTLRAKLGARKHIYPMRYFGALFFKPVENYVLSRVPNVMVPSDPVKEVIRDKTKARMWSISDGISYEKIQKIEPYQGEKPDIFIATRMVKLKGLDVLVRAAPIIMKSFPDLRIYIAGHGPYLDTLKTLVTELNLENHVKFVGFISGEEEKFSYYKACKIVVAPTRWDLQPYAVVEAAVSGKPSVISDAGNAGIVEDEKIGLLFKSDDVEDLAAKVVRLLEDDKLREEMGQRALEKAKEWDWDRLAERTVEICKTVIADFHGQKALR